MQLIVKDYAMFLAYLIMVTKNISYMNGND